MMSHVKWGLVWGYGFSNFLSSINKYKSNLLSILEGLDFVKCCEEVCCGSPCHIIAFWGAVYYKLFIKETLIAYLHRSSQLNLIMQIGNTIYYYYFSTS